jgi:hypothetical protein
MGVLILGGSQAGLDFLGALAEVLAQLIFQLANLTFSLMRLQSLDA